MWTASRVANEVEAANIATLRDLLDQGDQRRRTKRIIRRDRARRLERIEFGARVKRGEQKIVVGGKWAALALQLRNAGLEQVAGAAFGRLGAIGNAIVKVRIDGTGDLPVIAEHVFPHFIGPGNGGFLS